MPKAVRRMGKRLGLAILPAIARTVPIPSLRRFCAFQLSRVLLDPAVLPRRIVARPIRGGISIPCDPYKHVHCLPYWTGRLHEEVLERFLRQHLKAGDTFLDIGANYGHFTLLAASLVGPRGRIYAFEPIPNLAELIRNSSTSLQLDNVEVFSCALGEREDAIALHINAADDGMSTVRNVQFKNGRPISVALRRGDDVLKDKPMPGTVFLKMDVEGYEPEALRGLSETLARRVRHAVIEVTPEWIGGADGVAQLFDAMNAWGLSPQPFGRGSFPGFPMPTRGMAPDSIREQCNVLFTRTRDGAGSGIAGEALQTVASDYARHSPA
jgi:FkbM family methyltransferase